MSYSVTKINAMSICFFMHISGLHCMEQKKMLLSIPDDIIETHILCYVLHPPCDLFELAFQQGNAQQKKPCSSLEKLKDLSTFARINKRFNSIVKKLFKKYTPTTNDDLNALISRTFYCEDYQKKTNQVSAEPLDTTLAGKALISIINNENKEALLSEGGIRFSIMLIAEALKENKSTNDPTLKGCQSALLPAYLKKNWWALRLLLNGGVDPRAPLEIRSQRDLNLCPLEPNEVEIIRIYPISFPDYVNKIVSTEGTSKTDKKQLAIIQNIIEQRLKELPEEERCEKKTNIVSKILDTCLIS